MENYCKGKMYDKDSVNDDLESFFEAEIDGNVPDWPIIRQIDSWCLQQSNCHHKLSGMRLPDGHFVPQLTSIWK